jgi:hypothetical protein
MKGFNIQLSKLEDFKKYKAGEEAERTRMIKDAEELLNGLIEARAKQLPDSNGPIIC